MLTRCGETISVMLQQAEQVLSSQDVLVRSFFNVEGNLQQRFPNIANNPKLLTSSDVCCTDS